MDSPEEKPLSNLIGNLRSWIPRRSEPSNVSTDFWMPDQSCRVCYETPYLPVLDEQFQVVSFGQKQREFFQVVPQYGDGEKEQRIRVGVSLKAVVSQNISYIWYRTSLRPGFRYTSGYQVLAYPLRKLFSDSAFKRAVLDRSYGLGHQLFR